MVFFVCEIELCDQKSLKRIEKSIENINTERTIWMAPYFFIFFQICEVLNCD